MSRTVVFAGPSLFDPPELGMACIDFRPPASCGDVIGAVEDGARTIGLIDGSFEHCPSIWHKELLWAIATGATIFGAASLGALRAAELHEFGMRGVGSVFAAYASGRIDADDEVALVHGPQEAGYVPLSLPLVNLRATVRVLSRQGKLSSADAARLIDAAREIYFKDRFVETIVCAALSGGTRRRRMSALLTSNMVDIKRIDATRLLRAILQAPDSSLAPIGVSDICTHYLDDLLRRSVRRRSAPSAAGSPESVYSQSARGRSS